MFVLPSDYSVGTHAAAHLIGDMTEIDVESNQKH